MYPVTLTKDLSTLLWQAVNDSAVYSALVPWILDTRQKAPTLSVHVQQRQLWQDCQLQAPHAVPQDMRQCVLQAVERCCGHACALDTDACPISTQAAAGFSVGRHTSKNGAAQQHPTFTSDSCGLPKPAAQLAKLHGHMLAHGLVPNPADQLQLLVLLLTSGPLEPSSNQTTTRSVSHSHSSSKSRQKKAEEAPAACDSSVVTAAAASGAVTSPEQLLQCRACAARYAAKALECCGKLLCCMPQDLANGLMASPHVQQYAPALVTQLLKASASSKNAATLSRNSAVVGNGSHPPGLGQQQQTPCTPAANAAAGSGADSLRAAAASGGLGSAGTPLGRPSTGGAGAKLSGLGMLVHNTPGSAGGRSTGGQGSAGRANNAAVCNREKSRDLFFSILRRCSSRLEALRQQQAAAADLQDPQHQAAAAAVFDTELQELMADVGIAAKQLLLQLAPGNLVYLAELFSACVLQAASTGEPILEPQLALMAERDPGKFHKLQQRLADRAGGAGAASPGLPPSAGLASRPRSAGAANRLSPAGARSNSAKVPAQRVTPQSVPLAQPQPQQQQCNGVSGGSHGHKARSGPVAQGLAATGLMYKMPPGSSNSTGGVAGKPLPTAPRQIRPTPSSAGGSTGNSFRLAAAVGLNTPVPFAGGSAAGPSPGASPLLPSLGAGVLAPGSNAAVNGSDVTPVLQQHTSSNSKGTSNLNPSVSRVVQLNASTAGEVGSCDGLFAGRAAGSGTVHKTPASAPAAPHATPVTAAGAPGSAPLKAHNAATQQASSNQQAGSIKVVQQLLADMPAGQHVLLLVLHAADSSSFNRCLLEVMLSRTEQLLASGPASLAAAGGLGQQATAIAALAGYCSYLSFVAGATEAAVGRRAATGSNHRRHQQKAKDDDDDDSKEQLPMLQQQPAVDVTSLLMHIADSGRNTSLDPSWCIALAIPFICNYLQFISFKQSAAGSSCVHQATQQLRILQALPCMSVAHPTYGSLPACMSSCLQHCRLLRQSLGDELVEPQQRQQNQRSNGDELLAASSDWWCHVLHEGSKYVDSIYWTVCCPGLQQLTSLLTDTAATVQRQQQQKQKLTLKPSERSSRLTGNKPAAEAAQRSPPAAQPPPVAAAAVAQDQQGAGDDASTAAAERRSTSPAGSVSSMRHTTPLLLAPREPPAIDKPPAVITAALAEVNDPLRQQLQQSFLGQYSTDDNPVKMRDVLALVNGILCANSLSLGLCQGVPPVLQQHVDTMSLEVQEQLGPVGAAARVPLQGQDLARAVHTICNQHSAPAIKAALESAMQKASDHACQAATAACTALLPADVPPAATSAAAALVAASCKASCAQRLLQEVPVLVQSSLADQADELVRLIIRQWAVHTRITAPTTQASEPILSSKSGGSGSCSRRVQPVAVPSQPTDSAAVGLAPGKAAAAAAARRINPVLVVDANTEHRDDTISSANSSDSKDHAAAVTPSQQQQAGAHDGSAESSSSPSSARAANAVDVSAAPVITVEDLVSGCSSCMSRWTACTGCAAEAEEVIGSMRQQVAATVAQPSVNAAVHSYLAAADKLVPKSSKQAGAGAAAEPNLMQQQQQQAPAHNPWCSVVRAAACTAELLIAGLAAGIYSLPALEQQLVQMMIQGGGSKLDKPTGGALVITQPSNAAADDSSGVALKAAVNMMLPEGMQQTMCQLLAGAVIHAFLTSPQQKSRVWDADSVDHPDSSDTCCTTQHFAVLPALLMKAARTEKPAWFLKQLRVWIQDTTLGC